MVYDVGTEIYVGSFADICADEVIIYGIYSGGGTLCDGPLPVELSSFNASIINNTIKLIWRTETEVNNFGFEVERKISDDWQKLGFVHGHGNSNSPSEYSYVDKNPIGGSKFQYRLKQIDNDGQFEYSDVVEVNLIPTKFALYQNYPNPFNPDTKISWQSPVGSWQTLKVYDVLGNEVATLVNEYKPAGIYNVEFTIDNLQLSSGVYFYQLKAGGFVSVKKMIMIK
ncbi:MAG: T9SS type A sorting domain-containing protein [Ignavibacteriales bacterium]|nr:T9SS type A sorting domain-containing protein [Ignavibacteriales bacterium]